jgi:excisionase family DNA binding protein
MAYSCNRKAAPAVVTHPGAWPRPTRRSRLCQRIPAPNGGVQPWSSPTGRSGRPSRCPRLRTAGAGARTDEASLVDALVEELADRLATKLAAQLRVASAGGDEVWLDTRRAAEYLGVHRDTLRKLAAERAVPSEQDGPGCKLFFRRGDLDEWRRTGGGSASVLSVLADAA